MNNNNEPSIDNAFLTLSGGPYTIRNGRELMEMPPVKEEYLWGAIPIHCSGATAAFHGAPGTHKSRQLAHLAVHQILGRPFAGMSVYPKPLRWLFLNAENSLARLQADLAGFARTLTPEERALVGEHLHFTSLERDADGDMLLDDRNTTGCATYLRIEEAVARVNPTVLVVDPWPAVCANELDATVIRHALGALRKAASVSSNGPVTLILVNHARPGLAEDAKAAGADALSYQRGSRVLNGVMRTVWNVRRCEIVDMMPVAVNPGAMPNVRTGVELIHAKANNAKLLPPTTIMLNDATGLYDHVPDFNHAAWQESIEKLAKSGATSTPGERAAAQVAVAEAGLTRVEEILRQRGPLIKSTLVDEMRQAAIASSERRAKALIDSWVERGKLKGYARTVKSKIKIMLPEQYDKMVG